MRIRAHGLLLLGVLAGAALPGCGEETITILDLCAGAACSGGCESDKDCQSGKKCDLAAKLCVQCLADSDCPAASLCRLTSHACVPACSGTHGCGDAGVCDVAAGQCVECLADGDCKDARAPRCDGKTSRCVACLGADVAPGNKDNCAVGQYCADEGGVKSCKPGCKEAADCAANAGDGGLAGRLLCDTATHACAQCLADTDCAGGQVCRGGSCGDGCNDQRPCPNGLVCCDGRCADLAHDPANCKACGVSCGGGVCCGGACANPAADARNCGACGNVCSVANGEPACISSACAVGFCRPGYGDCNGSYVDGCETSTDTNVNHCGSCNFACVVPNALPGCAKGACTVATCLAPWADCNGKVVDGCEVNRDSDVKNCGGCGLACSANHVAATACAGGRCVSSCAAGFADCNGDRLSDGCEIAIATDVNNCGACGTICSSNHGTPGCSAGACTIACEVGAGNCDGDLRNGCENSLNSNNNCGACGTLCNLPHAVSECTTRTCKIATCEAGWADCNGNPADGCEVRTATDVANCGTCGKACAGQNGQAACNGGICSIVCGAGFADCNGNPNDGCETQVANNIANCGVCGSACSSNRVIALCTAGVCNGGCENGWSDCNQNKRFDGCEINTAVDVNNCGICGNICAPPHAVPRCTGGACGIATCEAGWANCDGAVNTGCEVPTDLDVNNCGACGRVCGKANGTASCAAGSCVIACAAGFGDCNNTNADGCETNLGTSVFSCGACGRVCSLPHATAGCAAAACTVVTCDPGWQNCDGIAANGCEVNTATDIQNCGGCGARCSLANNTPTCVAGACQITCVGGFGDCNGDVNDGCEARLATDTGNCGACGVVCSPSHVAINACGGGVCSGVCAAGFADCNGNKQIDGCETDVDADKNNCGACGTRCSSNHVNASACSGGACTGMCAAGFADCDGNLQSNGCEKGIDADINNCGGCGLACSQNNVAASCAGGACTGTCRAGFGNCNNNLQSDGCETNLDTDKSNCGTCGTACSGANVVGNACAAGTCTGTCAVGFGDCDGLLQTNGCEVDLRTDTGNCGACGTVCSGANVVGSACVAGACAGMCAMGFGDCDNKLQQNGCETDLNADRNNCGVCGMTCAVGKNCVMGTCQ